MVLYALMDRYKKHKPYKKIIIAVIALALLLGAGAYIYIHNRDSKALNPINYGPPTEQEKQAANEQKQENVERETIDKEPATTKQDAKVIIVDGSQYGETVEIRSYIQNVYEDGGECKAVLSKSGQTSVSATSTAFKDATTTQCGPINIPRTQFNAAGNWDLVITYTSPAHSGMSTKQTVALE